MISAKVRADSVGPHGCRLTTMELSMPRFILAQFATHRVFSRNAASSRAVPVSRMIEKVRKAPFVPAEFGANQKGMQAGDSVLETDMARNAWLDARDAALECAERLASLGVHKQLANRLLEPFSFVTVLVSSTEWDNFFKLRLHHAAQPEMQALARSMKDALDGSTPARLEYGQWHVPFGEHVESLALLDRIKVATARCARISYETHDGEYSVHKDLDLHDRLLQDGHLSPFEHCAKCESHHSDYPYANYQGWASYRYHLQKDWFLP